MIHPLSGGPDREVVRSDGLESVAWSPDGETLAFIAQHRGELRVWTVPAVGGEPRVHKQTLASEAELAWAPSERIIYLRSSNRNFGMLDPNTGEEHSLISDESVGWVFDPTVSPDGSTLAVWWNRERKGIWTIDIADGTERFLSASNRGPIGWSSDGRDLYFRNASLLEIEQIPASGGEAELWRTLDPGPRRRAFCLVMATEDILCTVVETTSDIWIADGVE